MSPQGTLHARTLADLDGAHVAGIAAGSGITPLMALAATVLARSDDLAVHPRLHEPLDDST